MHRAAAIKHWQETRDIARRIRNVEPGTPAAVATVIRIEGSAYRRPGAKLLIEGTGAMQGGVSGGCLEADVKEVGLAALREGRSCTRRYETGAEADTVWGLGLGCEGRVELLVQPVTNAGRPLWHAVADALDGDRPFVLASLSEGPAAGRSILISAGERVAGSSGDAGHDHSIVSRAQGHLTAGKSAVETIDGVTVFFDVLLPPPWLSVFGAGDDAAPVVRLAAELGFRCAVVDHRAAFVTAERFPEAHRYEVRRPEEGVDGLPLGEEAAALVMTHALAHDIAWVRAVATTPVMYLGVLGPQRRVARILAAAGVPAGGRVYGPVGLDLGAVGPEQIALSVLAELLAVRAGRDAASLRERGAAIHA
jgi:xanthine/CO dehydrogenase XdhC/CoxF family maturation factor